MKKYELTNDTINHFGRTLHRIKALRDITRHKVKAGNLGGYIETENNLSHYGDCWVDDNAEVYGNAQVSINAIVFDNAWVYENAWVFGDARVYGSARVSGTARVFDDAWVAGNAEVFGYAEVYENAWVFGDACIRGGSKLKGGITTKQSYQLTLPEHDIAICSPTEVRVNGYTKTIDEWVCDFNNLCNKYNIMPSQTPYKHLLYLKQNWSDLAPKPHDDEHVEQQQITTHGIVKNTDEGWHNLPDDKAYPILLTKTDGSNPVVVEQRYMLQWVYECGHKEPINEGDKWYSLKNTDQLYFGN